MVEIFKPRENMVRTGEIWICCDEHNKYICDGGPSIIWEDGSWSFYISKIGYHRLDGPATSYGEWNINGKNITKEIYIFAEENDIDLYNLTDDDKVIIALKFG